MNTCTLSKTENYVHFIPSRLEIKRVKKGAYIRALILGPFFVSVKLIIFLTFVTYTYTEHYMSAEKVFVTIGLYQAIRLSTMLFIPFGIQFAAETRVTCKRIKVSNCSSILVMMFFESKHVCECCLQLIDNL